MRWDICHAHARPGTRTPTMATNHTSLSYSVVLRYNPAQRQGRCDGRRAAAGGRAGATGAGPATGTCSATRLARRAVAGGEARVGGRVERREISWAPVEKGARRREICAGREGNRR
jgi:hypothetical protein